MSNRGKVFWEKVPKSLWYRLGGFSQPGLVRRHNGRCWEYFIVGR